MLYPLTVLYILGLVNIKSVLFPVVIFAVVNSVIPQ